MKLAQEEASRLRKEVADRECFVASARNVHAAILAHPGLSDAAVSRVQDALRSTSGIWLKAILISRGRVAGADEDRHPPQRRD
jgi:hypothetical protein